MRISRSLSMDFFLPLLLAAAYASLFSGIEFKVGPIKLRPIEFFSMMAFFFSLYENNFQIKKTALKTVFLQVFFVVFVVFFVYRAVLGIPFSKVIFVKELFQLVEVLFFWLCFSMILVNEKRMLHFFKMFFFGLMFIGVFNVLDHWASGIYFSYKNNDEPKMVYGLVVLMTYCFYRSGIKVRYLGCLSIIFVILMILSGERKSWIALLSAITVAEFFFVGERLTLSNFKSKFSLVMTTIFLVGLIVAVFSKAPLIEKQLSAIQNFSETILSGDTQYYEDGETVSNRARLYAIDLAARLYQENPIFGIGTEQYIVIIKEVAENDTYAHGVHNYYLEILVENGNVGIVIFVLLLFCTFFYVVNIKFSKKHEVVSYQAMVKKFSFCLFAYGLVLNTFLAGGIINQFFVFFPVLVALVSVKQEMVEQKRIRIF